MLHLAVREKGPKQQRQWCLSLGAVCINRISLTPCTLVAGRCSGCGAPSSSQRTHNSSGSQPCAPAAPNDHSQDALHTQERERERENVVVRHSEGTIEMSGLLKLHLYLNYLLWWTLEDMYVLPGKVVLLVVLDTQW